jgi:hypothetical protein
MLTKEQEVDKKDHLARGEFEDGLPKDKEEECGIMYYQIKIALLYKAWYTIMKK